MGALGWSPNQFWCDATWNDCMIAIDGYAVSQGATAKDKDYPSKEFILEMMERFPDGDRSR